MAMPRRVFLAATASTAASWWLARPAMADTPHAVPLAGVEHLGSTALIQSTHPRIVALAREITASSPTPVAAAVAIHDWVRDQIAFGVSRRFYETEATQVLSEGLGYCNTKVSLFSALLRASGIATRMRVMDLSAQVLHGLFDSGTPYVDHAITEVALDGRWLKVDSYVVDLPLADSARRRLKQSGAKAGFGVHADGKSTWDGRSDSFIQCLDNASIPGYVLKDHGLFDDIAHFYNQVPAARNRKTLASGLVTYWIAPVINRRIDSIRMG